MKKQKNFFDNWRNRVFSTPSVAQFWGRRFAKQVNNGVYGEDIPFARLRKPLNKSKIALITTGGIHLGSEQPYDMDNPDGDASYREIPENTDMSNIAITHNYYDFKDASQDLNIIFPIAHFRDLINKNVLGSLAHTHYGFMGHIDGPQLPLLIQKTAPEVATKLLVEGVDIAFLTPA